MAVGHAVEELQQQIAGLISERQELRAHGASGASLERNRLELVRIQWDFSHALIRRHAPQRRSHSPR